VSARPQASGPPATGEPPAAGGLTGGRRSALAGPAALVLTGIVSVQLGAGLATRLFTEVPAAAVTGLRLWAAAVAMLIIGARGRNGLGAVVTGIVRNRAWRDAATVIAFGVCLGGMNFVFYQAIARIPLGVAVTIEFLGPLAVAVAGSRRLVDLIWVALAATGVVLLTGDGTAHLNVAGIVFAALSAAGWAAYIMLSSATGRRFRGSSGLVIAMLVAAVVVTPPAVATANHSLLRPSVITTGAAVGVLSSALPYALELQALRRLSTRVFGIWMSLEPAAAALIGLALLGQHLSAAEWAAVACIVIASVGAARGTRSPSSPVDPL
jgi:inner membrane transporter RhtA